MLSEEEADFIHSLVESTPYSRLLSAMLFLEEKRPITADKLKRISLEKIAAALCMSVEYAVFSGGKLESQPQLALRI